MSNRQRTKAARARRRAERDYDAGLHEDFHAAMELAIQAGWVSFDGEYYELTAAGAEVMREFEQEFPDAAEQLRELA